MVSSHNPSFELGTVLINGNDATVSDDMQIILTLEGREAFTISFGMRMGSATAGIMELSIESSTHPNKHVTVQYDFEKLDGLDLSCKGSASTPPEFVSFVEQNVEQILLAVSRSIQARLKQSTLFQA